MEKIKALADFLNVGIDEIFQEHCSHYGLEVYSFKKKEYAIGNAEVVKEALEEHIKNSVWTFNSSFLSDYTNLPEKVFTKLQDTCEDSNDTVLELIKKFGGISGFIEKAIESDGSGHFLASYDGKENQENDYFIYRIN